MDEDRRESAQEGGESSTTRVLVMLAILVSLVAILGLTQMAHRPQQIVPWATKPFEAGVAVQKVEFATEDAVATITVDDVGWADLAEADQVAIGKRLAAVAAPHGAKIIHISSPSGTPLATATPTSSRIMPAPPVP